MAEVEISPIARADLREIGDYISHELRNPTAALRLIQRFRKAIRSLGEFPNMGAPLLSTGKQNVPYRTLVCGSYVIFYHVSSDTVRIDRVLYGRRDYLALLFGDRLEDE